jgi:GMP synthase (glutamine-hydrolysing)
MNIHYFQHVPFENPGYIEKWANKNNHRITSTKFFEDSYQIPALDEIDCLIVMGGPMSVHDNEKYSWLKEEKLNIQKAIHSNKKILGICLGAQLITDALGVEVYPNSEKEIGWFEVEVKPSFQYYLPGIQLPAQLNVFHWHSDTFDLPEGAINHVSSENCQNQLFTIGENIMGVQFHFEATNDTVKAMVANCYSELVAGRYIQKSNEILNNNNNFHLSHLMLESILNRFIKKG